MRKLGLAMVTVLAGVGTAWAGGDVASWNRDLERLDQYMTPPLGGDNNFFTSAATGAGQPNVVLAYPAGNSLREFTRRMAYIRSFGTGCANTYLNDLDYYMPKTIDAPGNADPYWAAPRLGKYDPMAPYPQSMTYTSSGQSDGLNPANAYLYGVWPSPGQAAPAGGGKVAQCAAAGAGAAMTAGNADCVACLDSKGYWLAPISVAKPAEYTGLDVGVFMGNWLRFHPPKWTLLSLAYKRLVNGPLLRSLREGVFGQFGTTGAREIQPMLPQDCHGKGRPLTQKLAAIDVLSYTSTARPLAEMLFNAAWYMSGGNTAKWGMTDGTKVANDWAFNADKNTFNGLTTPWTGKGGLGKSGPCDNCGSDFIVLFSDGRGDEGNPTCTAVGVDGCNAVGCAVAAMGAEDDGDDFNMSTTFATSGEVGGLQQPAGTCAQDMADDVARWMQNNPINDHAALTGSTVRTFVIGIGDPGNSHGEMNILNAIAYEGGSTSAYIADNFESLEQSIELVFKAIRTAATSFSSTTVTTVQTTGTSAAFVPRFQPEIQGRWRGQLSRFELYNEFAAGCTSANHSKVDDLNPNGDTSCSDFFLRDSNGDYIAEHPETGRFGVVDRTVAYDGGWPLQDPFVPAVPYWEASAELRRDVFNHLEDAGVSGRRIYTAQPLPAGNTYESHINTPAGDGLVDFTVANVAAITPLLKLGGATGEWCTRLAAAARRGVYATEDECAEDVIRFIHGEDVLWENPANRVNPPPTPLRPRVDIMADIFHSSPILVTPPVPKFLCDLGLINQCVPSLYLSELTPLASPDPYEAYRTTWQYRKQLLLVGTNDGLLHAFNAAEDEIDGTTGAHRYNLGTGHEVWAFIPPDMLPKLIHVVLSDLHQITVDGTPMVRDIWADGSGATAADGVKQDDEYHTVAITGEREGGRGYSALDVTDPDNPKFLWAWSPPGNMESLQMGGTWNDVGASAPPIGPIAEAFGATETVPASWPLRVGVTPAKEKYVVAFGGGYEPTLMRGASIHVVDAWTGEEKYRFARMDASVAGDLRYKMGPVAAPVSLIDADSDYLFDTAVVGDVLGQVWTVRMANPGTADLTGKYTNWHTARAFVQNPEFATASGQLKMRSPFFHRAVAARMPNGDLVTYLGSGDRDHIKDSDLNRCGVLEDDVRTCNCGPDNVMACIRQGCSVSVTTSAYRVGPNVDGSGGQSITSTLAFAGGTAAALATDTRIYTTTSSVAAAGWVPNANTQFTFNCPEGGGDPVQTMTPTMSCAWASSPECLTPGDLLIDGSIVGADDQATNTSYFYALKLFDSGTRSAFTTAAGASTYDTNRLTDQSLVDVTAGTTLAAMGSNGWRVSHTHSTNEKTATTALVYGGCVLWSSLDPNVVAPGGTCGGGFPTDREWAFQADAITGAIGCGQVGSSTYNTTVRSVSREVKVAPQQSSPVVSVNPNTGLVEYRALNLQAGSPPTSKGVGIGSLSGVIHWLEVPRKVHECRHDGTNCD